MAKLITGGVGFVGSHLATELLESGEEVVLLDIVPGSKLIGDIKDKVKVVVGDVSNWAQFLGVVKENKVDGIYHMGAVLSGSGEDNPQATYVVNASGIFNVLEAARLFDLKMVMFLSTMATYGPGIPDPVSDDAVQKPTTIYGVTKAFSERLGEYYHRKYDVNFRGVRYPSVIGPGRKGGGISAYSSLMVQEPAAGKPYVVFVGQDTKIALLYIKDAVRSLLELGRAEESKLKRRVYNVYGFSPTATELADAVRKCVPDAKIEFNPIDEMMAVTSTWPKKLDDSCAHEDWNWKAQYTLDKAIEDFVGEVQARTYLYE